MGRHQLRDAYTIILSALLLAAYSDTFADNYMRSEGESYYSARLQGDTANQMWNQQDQRVPMPCTARNWNLTQSYEYGLSYYNTLFGSLDYVDRNCGIYDASRFGNFTLGIRRRLDIYRNGRSWEAEAIIPTGYSTSGRAAVGSGRYGLRLGIFGAFGDINSVGDPCSPLELGGNIYIWEGKASEQLSGYAKTNFLATASSHFYGVLEGDYALINRSKSLNTSVNPISDYGYDRLNVRLGFSTKITLKWRASIEGSKVLRGRNTNDSRSAVLMLSRDFLE